MSIISEKELIAAIRDGLPGVEVVWGFLEFESAQSPPSLPLVAVSRVNATVLAGGGLKDMCDEDDETADILVQADAWQKSYENARNLNEQVHVIIASIVGWSWQSDIDIHDSLLKAWRISSTWNSTGER
jgi:hypothetical protein